MRVWVFPMAGKGLRVRTLGPCKPAISIAGRTVLEWCLTGLSPAIRPGDSMIVITTREHESTWGISELARVALNHLELDVQVESVVLDDTPPGPAASVHAASSLLRSGGETIVCNHDQFIQFRFPDSTVRWDGFVPLFVSTSESASYAEVVDGHVTRVVEKVRISHTASAGVYGFRTGATLVGSLETTLQGRPHFGGEYYVGPAMNDLIGRGQTVVPTGVVSKFDLGTISGISQFGETIKRIKAPSSASGLDQRV